MTSIVLAITHKLLKPIHKLSDKNKNKITVIRLFLKKNVKCSLIFLTLTLFRPYKYEVIVNTQNCLPKSRIPFAKIYIFHDLDLCGSYAYNLGELVENNM